MTPRPGYITPYTCPACGTSDPNAFERCHHGGCPDGRDQVQAAVDDARRTNTTKGPCAPQCYAECDFGEGHGKCAAEMVHERHGQWGRTPLMLRVIGYADQRRPTYAPWQLGGGFDGWEYGDGTLAPERAATRGVLLATARYLVHIMASGLYWSALVNALAPWPPLSLKTWLLMALAGFIVMTITAKD